MLPEFDLILPDSLAEALDCLASGGVPLAGGTNLVVDLRGGRQHPALVVNIASLPELKGIHLEDNYVIAGAGVTLSELLASHIMAQHARPLQDAARLFASPLVRNRATLGGNLADASPAADSAPPLLVLDAEVELRSRSGARWLPLAEFFLGVRRTALAPGELITAIRWPVPTPQARFAYAKLGLRKADAISVVSAAIRVDLDADNTCQQARIALGSVAPVPLRAMAAEACLTGQPLNLEAIQQAAQRASEAASPISDLRASAAYRRQMVAVLVRRLLQSALSPSPAFSPVVE